MRDSLSSLMRADVIPSMDSVSPEPVLLSLEIPNERKCGPAGSGTAPSARGPRRLKITVNKLFLLAASEKERRQLLRNCVLKAAMAKIETGQPVRAYGDFHHMTKPRSWARPRRVIAKVEHKPGHEQRCRFLVTPSIAIKSRPGNSTRTSIARAATWKTASRTANSICSPIA